MLIDDVMWLQVYKERVLDVAVNCAREASRTGVKRFIHMSTAQVYNSDKVAMWGGVKGVVNMWEIDFQIVSHEGSKLDPWTTLAQFHLKAERALEQIDGWVLPSPLFPSALSSHSLPN